MYKNLSALGLGISGRQSEMIELALTYGFKGLDVDMERLVKQAQRNSLEHAGRFIDSAGKFAEGFAIGGWDVGIDWDANDADYATQLAALGEAIDVAAKVGAKRCFTTVQPASDALAYHENFERLRTRLTQVAGMLAPHEIQLGLNYRPAPVAREGKEFEFIHDFEGLTTLCSTVGAANVGIVLDTWTWFVGGGGMDQLESLSIDQIVAVRIADVPADADMATIKENQRILPSEEGLIDCDAVLKLLVDKAYEGPVTPFPRAAAFSGQTRESIVQKAADCLEEMWITVGLSKPKAALIPVGVSANGEADVDDSDDNDDSNDDES